MTVTGVVLAIPLALAVHFGLAAAGRRGASAAGAAPVASPLDRRITVSVTALFFLSGFAGLLYEVVFAKSLALAFGSTAVASTTVLATYMGGMALGSWLGGRLGARRHDPLRLYALCEAGIGVSQ